ncbi:Voltage-gated Ion Channel (VIC) Superfamily [Phytophthora cinnamomi]|uniref:Voltage-gated Ion Channel (VIC) Superfamily n=1 Tax=Phytophthora cinnamomi TaxID=4785 RepID=UPI00355A0858|nr:Voltage-gated Ion Channel (VIC) Superfamily [Phytophthora cinnamomi]
MASGVQAKEEEEDAVSGQRKTPQQEQVVRVVSDTMEHGMDPSAKAAAFAPLSPLGVGTNDDLLAALDEMLAFTPEAAATATPLPLDGGFAISDAFELLEVPNPYETSLQIPCADGPIAVAPQQQQQQQQQPNNAQKDKDARATPYAKAKPRRRKRPKDELDYLRAKVADLEEELTKLNQTAGGRLSPVSDDEGEMFSRWKQVAERQKEEANRTVVENLKLRAMLKGQIEIAKRLEAAIADHQQEAAAQAFPWNAVKTEFNVEAEEEDGTTRRPRAPSIADEMIFAELNGSLEAQYAQVDSLFEANGIANLNREMLGKINLQQDLSGISFGLKEVRLMPFSMQAVARLMWSFLLFESNNMPGRIQTRVINNDHLNATIVDTLQLPKSRRTEVFTRLAVRRYFEANRVVLVWSGCVEIAGSVFVRLRERGVNTLSTFDFTKGEAASGAKPEGCILRAVIDVRPETIEFSPGADTQGHIGEMTDLVLGTYHRTFGMLNQVMENLLLKELMGCSAPNQALIS